MSARGAREPEITPQVLLKAYACGIFPMADSADDPNLFWIEPEERGIIPLDGFHIPKRLQRSLRTAGFEIRIDTDFEAVISGCAEPAALANENTQNTRDKTWINARIRKLYGELFQLGHCHTVETWKDGALVGGLYGISLGAAFFGESMFARQTDASKAALVHLVERLKVGGYRLLDTQFNTPHLARFGAIEVPREEYQRVLAGALEGPGGVFDRLTGGGGAAGGVATTAGAGARPLQSTSQTS